jgi:hypothetical protein
MIWLAVVAVALIVITPFAADSRDGEDWRPYRLRSPMTMPVRLRPRPIRDWMVLVRSFKRGRRHP